MTRKRLAINKGGLARGEGKKQTIKTEGHGAKADITNEGAGAAQEFGSQFELLVSFHC